MDNDVISISKEAFKQNSDSKQTYSQENSENYHADKKRRKQDKKKNNVISQQLKDTDFGPNGSKLSREERKNL